MTNGYHTPKRPAKKTPDSQKAQADKPKTKEDRPEGKQQGSGRK